MIKLKAIKININKLHIWLYVLLGIATIIAYPIARALMIEDIAWYYKIISNITVNFVLLLFLYGVTVDKMTKHMSRKKGWIIWGIGFIVLILFFKYVAQWPTIFG